MSSSYSFAYPMKVLFTGLMYFCVLYMNYIFYFFKCLRSLIDWERPNYIVFENFLFGWYLEQYFEAVL